jgi:VWFA-related protein
MGRLRRFTAVSLLMTLVLTAQPRGQQPAGQPPTTGQSPAQPPAQPADSSDQPAGQPADPASSGQPTFRAGINFVRVDVIVTDKNGNPVADLKPGDFEITEQGKPQTVDTFKLISLDGGLMATTPPREIRTDLDEENEASRDDVRLFGIFLDDYHVRLGTSMSAREQLGRFVETQLGPSDMVGLMYPLQPTSAVRMTRNHGAIIKALNEFRGRKYDYTPKNELEEKYAYYPTETVERIRNQVSLSALKGMIIHMGTLKEGRKALILVSEGYSNMVPPQMRDQMAAMPGLGNPQRNNPDAGVGSLTEDRAAFSAAADMEMDLRDVYAVANRNNTAIYAVDPRGLATGEFGIDQNIGARTDRAYLSSTMETLRTLALQTDGRAIVNRNDLTAGMKQIVRDSSAYYLLGYNSTFTATDGKFHEIKVKVNRPGIQVRARKGYWAFTAEDAAKAVAPPKPETPKAVDTALAAISVPSRSRLVRTWIGTERGAGGSTKITFVWEPVARAPGDAARANEVPAQVSLIATGADGGPIFRGRVPEVAAAATTATAAATLPGSKISFDVPPGKLQLRLAVEDASAEVLDSEVREIVVPDLTAPSTMLATPEIFRARTVPELQRLKADPQAIPTAIREFRRTDRVFLRVMAYAPGSATATITAKVLNRAGQAIADLPVGAPAAGGAAEIDLALPSLAPGDYLIEIAASAEGGEAKELVGFRITG